MSGTEIKFNRPLLTTINFVATVIDVMVLFYSFKQLKSSYFLLGVVGILLMIVTTCLECYFCRNAFRNPRIAKIRKFIISLLLMYIGLLMLITAVSLNKSWNFRLACTVICQVLYSCISFFALYCISRIKPINLIEERESTQNSNSIYQVEQIPGAYSPEIEDDGTIYVPPELYHNYGVDPIEDSTQLSIDHSSSSDIESPSNLNLTESGINLTSGLQYRISSQRTSSSPAIYLTEKYYSLANDNKEFYQRSSSLLERYGVPSNKCSDSNENSKSASAQFLESSTTGAFSEYDMLYGQPDMLDGSQPLCNPYANVYAENII